MEVKRHWLGQHWYLPGAAGNDINKVLSPLNSLHASFVPLITLNLPQTNVPNIRLAYRHQTLLGELNMIRGQNIETGQTLHLPTADRLALANQVTQ
jgi:AMP deaminase